MDSIHLPVLKIELEGIKNAVMHSFTQNNEELNKMVMDEIDRQLNLDYIQSLINDAVRQCIVNAIDDVSNNYKLKSAITSIISESIANMIDPNKNKEDK